MAGLLGDLLDLVFASGDIEGLIVSHDIDGSHVSSDFAADGALTQLDPSAGVTHLTADSLGTGLECWTESLALFRVRTTCTHLQGVLDSLTVAGPIMLDMRYMKRAELTLRVGLAW